MESQIESAQVSRKSSRKPQLTPEQIELARKRDSLQLSRTRVLHDLQNACNARHRQILEQALAHLDQKLTELG